MYMDLGEILKDADKIISEYNPYFHDSFGKNRKIYEQAKIIKYLLSNFDLKKKYL